MTMEKNFVKKFCVKVKKEFVPETEKRTLKKNNHLGPRIKPGSLWDDLFGFVNLNVIFFS